MPAGANGQYRPGVYAWNTEDLDCREVAESFEGFLSYLSDCDSNP